MRNVLIPCYCFLLLSFFGDLKAQDSLESYGDEELLKLVEQESYVVVLFSKDNCEICNKFESELAAIREDLVDSLNAWVVKSFSNTIKNRYSPSPEPVIVFFRSGHPVLYEGEANDEEILENLIQNKEPCVQELTDASFEHLTQASMHSTTGDWFVFFYKDECEECNLLFARWETLGCLFRGRINVAKINRGSHGAVTGRRFDVTTLPSLLFFRQGRMYRYTLDKHDVSSYSNFISGFYANFKAESIPLPKTPFDDLVQLCVDYLREYPFVFIGAFGVPIIFVLSFMYLIRSEEPKTKKKKKKKKTTTTAAATANTTES